jgi:hypothetical protein
VALFTNDAISVHDVEAEVRAGRMNIAGTERVERTLEIGP